MPPGVIGASEGGPTRKLRLAQLEKPARSSGGSARNSTSDGAAQLQGREVSDAAACSKPAAAASATGAASAAAHRETLAHTARLEGANAQLRERLTEALDELSVTHAQLRILQGLQQQLEDATPGAAELVETALEQERALQAARDAQVLQLLRTKDEVINSFEARYAECRAEAAQHKEALATSQAKLENSQLRVSELVQSKGELRRQLDQAAATGADEGAALRAEVARLQEEAAACEPLRQQVRLLEGQLSNARDDLSHAHQQMETLADTVDAANPAIMEVQTMLAEQEKAVSLKEAEASDLHRHLAQLLGLPQEDARLVHRAQYGGGNSRIAALEAANERLEAALVDAARAAAAGGLPAQPPAGGTDVDAVGQLLAELAVATGKLQAADERIAQLEKLLKIAEATVLHNEVQLQDALEGRTNAEEQVYSLRIELEDGQALMQQLRGKLEALSAAEQAAQSDATAVRGTLSHVVQTVAGMALPAELRASTTGQQQQQRQQAITPATGLLTSAAAADLDVQSCSGAGHEVEAALRALQSRISDLKQQVSQRDTLLAAEAAAAAQQAVQPERQAVGVQCEVLAVASTAVQVMPAEDGIAAACGTQTDTDAEDYGGARGGTYGRPDALQQQLAELTAQLAASRLEAVAAKAEHSALEARLLDTEHQLQEHQKQEQATAARHSLDCSCHTALQLRAEVEELQAKVEELNGCITAARASTEAQLACVAADAQAEQQVLHAQLAELQSSASELRELRSSAYATITHLRYACHEQGVSAAPPDGCEPGSLPQQLRRAADQVLAMLQEHSELVTAFQQHVQQDASPHNPAAPGIAGLPLEPAQRAVIRSLAAQLASHQLRLETAEVHHSVHDRVRLLSLSLALGAGSVETESCPASLQPSRAPGGDPASSLEALVGMVYLLTQQLAGLDRIQAQLMGRGVGSPGAASPDSSSGSTSTTRQLTSTAHAAALLGTELPSLHATVAVLEAEVRRMVSRQKASPAAVPSSPDAAATAPSGWPDVASEEAARRAEKWKGRCKELRAQLAAAERAAAEHAATVRSLHQRVEDLAAAGSQLEAVLRDTAQQLTQALCTADELQARLQQQQEQHAEAGHRHQAQLQEAGLELAASKAAFKEQRQENAALAARMEALKASLHTSGDAEEDLRANLQELGEQVAVLTAAQEASKAEVFEQRQALIAAQQELGAARASYAALAAEKQRREEELAGLLQGLQQECRNLLCVVEQAEQQQVEMEERFQARVAVLGSQLLEIGDSAAAHIPAVESALGKLRQSAEELDLRLLRLEAQAAVAAEDRQEAAGARWANLERCQRYRAAVRQLRDGLQAQLLDAQAASHQQAAQLDALQSALEAAQAESEELAGQLQEVQVLHQGELQQLAGEHQVAVAALQQQAEERQQLLQQRAEAAAAEAIAVAEDRCRVESTARACQLQQRALADLEAAAQQCTDLQAQLDAVRTEFQRYQAIKAVEVRLLEQRVLRQLGVSGSSGSSSSIAAHRSGSVPGATGASSASLDDLEAACRDEGIAAALREARLERLRQQQLEGDLAAARAAEEQVGQLRSKARAAEQELAAARSRHAADHERVERLAAELADCQAALRLAKSEGSRRLKELQALQRAAADSENSGPNAAAQLEGEQEARKAAETRLREARQALARKAELIKDLRSKVATLERELAAQDPAPLAAELEACQARLRQAQAACASKEAAVRELRERLQQQSRLARQQGALEEREAQQPELLRLSRKLSARDTQLAEMHSQLRQVHQELAATTADLQQAASTHSAEADSATGKLIEARQCVQQLAHSARLLLDTLAQLAAAAAAASEPGGGSQEADTMGAAARNLAGLVDLSPDDIGAVLSPSTQRIGGHIGGAASVQAAAQQVQEAMEKLEGQVHSQNWQQALACAEPLGAATRALQEQCYQVGAALEAAGGTGELHAMTVANYF